MERLNLKNGISAALENGDRLVDDARSMLDWERFPTAYALAVLAQEEYAKALLLSLIEADAIPWSDDVQRALRDHVSKQLVSVILATCRLTTTNSFGGSTRRGSVRSTSSSLLMSSTRYISFAMSESRASGTGGGSIRPIALWLQW